MTRPLCLLLTGAGLSLLPWPAAGGPAEDPRPRVIVETDAGGDPDDEQSLVRFLLYTNELDVEGIIVNRRDARDGENLNTERTGIGIVRRLVDAYGVCWPNLRTHDHRYPAPDVLRRRVVSGLADSDAGVRLIRAAVERRDPRPVWFLNWGTIEGTDPSSLERALDAVLRERGPAAYARFKAKLRLSSDDQFGPHTKDIAPPFPLWVDTFRPPRDGKRWYHRFSELTATAGGFDLERDVRRDHGPLGALYPTNTTHRQKEGDTPTFLYLLPSGPGNPEEPGWGSWAGRYGPRETFPGKPYYWASVDDTWQGSTHRDNTLRRFAAHLQNDFRARLDWCVRPFGQANRPPRLRIRGEARRTVRAGEPVTLDALASADPDDELRMEWVPYPEASGYRAPLPEITHPNPGRAVLTFPAAAAGQELHVLLQATDTGDPPLTRYRRFILQIRPSPGE